jgi:tetratricopeptide (TPR) repeat protein
MSLLLEALKKAELAKQVAKAEAPPEPETAPPEPAARRVITREKLPDITQPLQILTDDLPSSETTAGGTAATRPEFSLQEKETFEPAVQPIPSTNEFAPTSERTQAQQLFQVKEMDYNPRRPFYLTLGALALVGLGYGGYVWWQMRPRYSLPPAEMQTRPVATPAQSATASASVAAPSQPAVAPPPPAQAPQAAVPIPAGTAVPGVPPIQAVRPPRPKSLQAAASIRPQATSTATGSVSPRAGEAPLASIAINAPTLAVDPLVEQAYQAFQRNDLAVARDGYQRALAREPTSRDALLGLAAIDVRSGQLSPAEARYLRLLEIDPRDSHAAASLISLRGQLDPVASESRLKSLIASQPEAALLHFSLGNQYAQQSRWTEAQAAYFKAYSVDPENADYAFNLAVSLDQLHQGKLALEFYQRALALTDKRAASFNPAHARLRVQELSQ